MQGAFIIILATSMMESDQDSSNPSSPIPENINNIFQTSCLPCHGDTGGTKSRSKLNFSKWTEYGPEKAEEKALLICKTLKKGKMPPESVRESYPELIPTKEQINLICQWAKSLKQ